jgi:hypothetical protein
MTAESMTTLTISDSPVLFMCSYPYIALERFREGEVQRSHLHTFTQHKSGTLHQLRWHYTVRPDIASCRLGHGPRGPQITG